MAWMQRFLGVTLVTMILSSSVPPCGAADQDGASFRYLPPRVGDVGVQEVDVTLDLVRQFTQHGARISDEKLHVLRRQQRRIHVLEASGKVATRVQVEFESAYQQTGLAEKPAERRPLPIHEKAYQVHRQGDQLHVTRVDGAPVPPAERELVENSMSAVGRPHPLGLLLDGRSLRRGETLEAPAELVREFLGGQASADATMRLTLTKLKGNATRPIAVFSTELVSGSGGDGDVGMKVAGEWEVDAASCQTISATFQGPIRSQELHGPIGAQYQVTTQGNLWVKVARTEATAIR